MFKFMNRMSVKRVRNVVTLLSILILLVLSASVMAQDVVTDDEVNEIAKEVYCPVCESTPLDVCETQACADWRELIRTKLGEGQTKQQIFDYFATQYGDRVLASPPKKGFNLILWISPFVALAIGAVAFGRYLQHLKTAAEGDVAPKSSVGDVVSIPKDKYVTQIEEELAKK